VNQILSRMLTCRLPSSTGRVIYTATDVQVGTSVTLESPGRKQASVLAWSDIETVFKSRDKALTPTKVDTILNNPQNRDSSTMCALVLAMWDPKRVRRA
jgi:hypothetical protein